MFKKINENKYVQKYKELRANPKTRSLISLGFWMLFLVVAVLLVRSTMSSNEIQSEPVKDEVLEVTNYEFTYRDNLKTIFGEVYDDRMIFYFNNGKYYKNGNGIYLVNENSLEVQDMNVSELNLTFSVIDDLVSQVNATEDNGVKTYLVPLSNFIRAYEGNESEDLTEATNYNVTIQTYEKDGVVYMVKLDLSNYYLFRGLPDMGIITINYYNVNKLNDFSLEYERMLEV